MVTSRLLDGLRALAESLPAGTPIPVPREALLELLSAAAESSPDIAPTDPTIEDVACRYHRAASTVRGWCEAGRFPGAYKLGREWRIPAAAIEAFDSAARGQERIPRSDAARVRSLGDWRHAS